MQVVLCGYYGYGNAGDEALLATLLEMLPDHCTPVILSADPVATERTYGVAACPNRQPGPLLATLRASQAFIWGGGSLIQDATSAFSPLYYLGLMTLAQQLGLTTLAWAQGIGPLRRPWVQRLARPVFRGCTAVSVRDGGSASLLQAWGVPHQLAPDPVWAMAGRPMTSPVPSQSRIAVVLRPHAWLTPAWIATLTEALAQLQRATGAHLWLIPFQPSTDTALAQALHAALPHNSQVLIETDVHRLRGLFDHVNLVLGMRYHSLVMGAAAGRPCIGLSYDPKVSRLVQECGLLGWFLADSPPPAQDLAAAWVQYYASPPSQTTYQDWVARALSHQQLLHHTLGGPGHDSPAIHPHG
ncbi:MAG: polysaccharide pyruvyl transferase CsaB [Gloeomargaritaceae cyanobacterium C42_A2020_066]|nr:polysaccharide pyruvyl transferase CsaB [Gloeomargaritaceae cyanobacterium C42_A2020_066]